MLSMRLSNTVVAMLRYGQKAGRNIGTAAIVSKDWVVDHPGQTAGIVSCVAAAPLAIAAAPLALGAAGFSSAGVVAGKYLTTLNE
jgi:hypothetical protein